MTPVVAISKPPIVGATTDIGIIIDSCCPSWVVIISGLVSGISAVDVLVCVGGGFGDVIVFSVSEKAVDTVSSEVVGCTSKI